jgi:hypothetical protein
MPHLIRPLAAGLACLGLGGCYEYVRAGTPAALVGERVQLVLTDAGSEGLASIVGPGTGELEGRLVADSAGVYVLTLLATTTRTGVESDWRGERVLVPARFAASVLERRFSRSRTMVAGGAAAAALVGATVALRGSGGATGSASTSRPIGSQ